MLSGNSNENLEFVQVFDISGKVLFDKTSMSQSEKIKTVDFPAGIYFVKIGVDGQVLTKRLIVE